MLLARGFSYADAHRARLGVNYKQIPVNRPKVPVHSYSKDGVMRVQNVSDPVYAPNSKGGPKADPTRYPQVEVWEASGEFVHAAYTKRKDDDDFGQAGTLVRKVMDNAQRDRLVLTWSRDHRDARHFPDIFVLRLDLCPRTGQCSA